MFRDRIVADSTTAVRIAAALDVPSSADSPVIHFRKAVTPRHFRFLAGNAVDIDRLKSLLETTR